MTKSLLELTASAGFKQRLAEGFKKTAANRTRLGLPKAVAVEGVIYKEYPDGRRERVSKPAPEPELSANRAKKLYSRTA